MNSAKAIIKQIAFLLISLGVLFLLQTSVFSNLQLAGVSPNFLIVFTVLLGLQKGNPYAMVAGITAGLLQDYFSSSIFGLYAVVFLYIGYLSGLLKKFFFGDDILFPLFMIFLGDILYGITMYLINYLPRGRHDIQYYMMSIIIPEAVYTIVVAIPLYYILLGIDSRINAPEQKRSFENFV